MRRDTGRHRASSARSRRAALVIASLLLGLLAWQTSVAAVTEDADPTAPALEANAGTKGEAPIEAGVAADAATPLLPIEPEARSGGGSSPAGGAGNEACASALTIRLAGEDAVVLGGTCAAANEDGTSQGDATTLALFGNEIVGASSHSEEGPPSDRTDPLSPICEGSSGAVCLQVLYAESSSSEDGGSAESHAALLFVCLGGSNPAPKAECDGLVQLAVGESHSGTTSNEATGGATADAESQLVDLCLGGEDPETGLCSGIGIGVAQAESHSEAPSPDEPGTTSGSSRPLSLEAGGEDVLGLTDPAAVEPLCPTVLCLFFNQEESAESEGGATGRQDVFLADLLGSPGTAEADAGTQTSATNPGTAPAPPRPRPRPAPQPAPPPRPGPAPAPVREAGPREPPEREEPVVTPTPSPTPQPEAPETGALAAPLLPTDPHRSQFVRSIPSPLGVDWLSGRTLLNMALALAAIPLLLFPGQIFSSTFEEHYEEIRGWFRPFRRRSQGPGAMAARTQRRRGGLVVLSLIIAFLYGFLSPDFGWNRASAALLLGVVGTIFLALVFGEIISALYLQRRVNDRFSLALYPWSIVIALVCIGVSRLADFDPGYLYASVAAATFAATLSTELEGKGAAVANVALLLGGLAAWFVWIPVRTAAEAADAGFWILVLDAILAATFIGALETVMFNLLPMRFMDGDKVLKWKKWVWAALFAASLFLFLHVLLKPGTGYIGTTDRIPFITIVALFVGFGLFSIGFWAYFRFRKPRGEDEPEPKQAEVAQAKPAKKKVPAARG